MYRFALLLLLIACGPTVRGDYDAGEQLPIDGGADAPMVDAVPRPDADPTRATLRGRVWAPGLAPGVAPTGQELPVSEAYVFVAATAPAPLPRGAYCERCSDMPIGAALTEPDGSFTLNNVPSGDGFLVIQKGQFRLAQPISLATSEIRDLTASSTMLPSRNDPDNGASIPRVAVAIGSHDRIEAVLPKIGLGTINQWGTLTSTDGEIDLYNNGGTVQVPLTGHVNDLLTDLDRLLQYHIVFFPCAGTMPGMNTEAVQQNLRRYVNAGGKLYVTDWSGVVADYSFPPQIEFGGDGIDTSGTYDPVTFTGAPGPYGYTSGDPYDTSDAEVVDEKLHAWLDGQRAPTPGNDTPSLINASHFPIVNSWNWIEALHDYQVGEDDRGFPVLDKPKAWVVGSNPRLGDNEKHPMAVTFQPTGCGRVMYTTFQTTNTAHVGMTPQERILVYLVLGIGACSTLPEID